jgi:hypothetical protein
MRDAVAAKAKKKSQAVISGLREARDKIDVKLLINDCGLPLAASF